MKRDVIVGRRIPGNGGRKIATRSGLIRLDLFGRVYVCAGQREGEGIAMRKLMRVVIIQTSPSRILQPPTRRSGHIESVQPFQSRSRVTARGPSKIPNSWQCSFALYSLRALVDLRTERARNAPRNVGTAVAAGLLSSAQQSFVCITLCARLYAYNLGTGTKTVVTKTMYRCATGNACARFSSQPRRVPAIIASHIGAKGATNYMQYLAVVVDTFCSALAGTRSPR